MRLLLDTHAFLWWMSANPALSAVARKAIGDRANMVMVSVASAWEMAIKRALGKLSTPDDLEGAVAASGFDILPIRMPHAVLAGALPRHHDDPFDRMLIAQAQVEGLTIVSGDEQFQRYGVALLST